MPGLSPGYVDDFDLGIRQMDCLFHDAAIPTVRVDGTLETITFSSSSLR